MFNVFEQAQGNVVQSSLDSTVSEAKIRGLVQTKDAGGTIINSVLSNTGLILPISEIDEKMVDRPVDELRLRNIEEASTTVVDD